MPHHSLGDFLSQLDDAGELVRIAAPVDSALELAEITRRVSGASEGGPAVFFASVRGSALPVVTNLLGSRGRLCRALGVRTLEELAARDETQAGPESASWLETLTRVPFAKPANSFPPRAVKQAYCQQIVKLGRDVNLWELPIPRSWPGEPHPVITLGQVVTRCPTTQRRSVELVPVEVLDEQQLLPCWDRYHRGRTHWMAAEANSRQLPIAIVLGGPACAALTALAALPEPIDPFGFTGWLNGEGIETAKCRTNDLEIPAQAEIVIEGMIAPGTPQQSPAPLAQSNGFYAERTEPRPVIQVSAVTHRANPLFPAQVFGPPPSEDTWMRLALERLFLPWIKTAAPEIVDWHFPAFGGGRTWLFVSLRKTYPLQARKVLHALWGHPLAMHTKNIVLVDERIDVQDADAVWFRVGAHVDPSRDLILGSGPLDVNNHAGPFAGSGHKLGIDATTKLPEERHSRTEPKELEMTNAMMQQVSARWSELKLPPGKEPKA